jgi:hypothetical protein
MAMSFTKLEELAKKLEGRLCDELDPVKKEKILIGGLNAAGSFHVLYCFLNDNHANYPSLSDVMDVYVGPNFSKQEERIKRLNSKESLGDFVSRNHESMNAEQLVELNKIIAKM